jgi:TATA-binding protein-associated factor Taf7
MSDENDHITAFGMYKRFRRHWDCENIETREERADRLYRERTEDALVASADLVDAATLDADAADRRYREAHPVAPSEAQLAVARECMAAAGGMSR